jgi:NADPH:quinone reductase-like Zn-dependent oxidoreductase
MNHNSKDNNELTLRDVEKPKVLTPNDVLVRIRAVSLNYRDVVSDLCKLK